MSHDEELRAWARRRGIRRYLSAAYRLVTSAAYRSNLLLRWRRPRTLFQACNYTRADRYPAVFRRAREKLGDGPELRLLSFGCSTGEEVFTLRQYFSTARIKGIDINPHNILVCRQRLAQSPDPNISFEVADSVDAEPAESYDAIFCMAVFRHGDLVDARFTRCDRLIRFADFQDMVAAIARRVKPGGLLGIAHANFRFRDTPTAEQFQLVCRMRLSGPGAPVTPVFDQENRRTEEINYDEVLFRKETAAVRST
jgi:2-polyprenyl-3-methyl-5-hydroxy-6-metoxy-1,4-benzoquinol methylase